MTRLTNAFSKKLDNFKAAASLHFAYYNKATRAYAWSAQQSGVEQFTAVLHVPPIDSPLKAVQASIVANAKKRN